MCNQCNIKNELKTSVFKFIGSGAPNLFTSTSSPALPPGQFNPAGMLGHNPQTSQYLPQIPYSTAGHMAFPGISQQSFPFLPPVSYCLSLPYLSTWLQNKNKNSNGCLYQIYFLMSVAKLQFFIHLFEKQYIKNLKTTCYLYLGIK